MQFGDLRGSRINRDSRDKLPRNGCPLRRHAKEAANLRTHTRHDEPCGGQPPHACSSPRHPGSPTPDASPKPRARNGAGAATKGAGGCNAAFDPIRRAGSLDGPRDWATRKRARGGNAVRTCREAKAGNQSRPRHIPQGCDECQTRGLLRAQKCVRASRGNLAMPASRETGGRWTAQPCNGGPRGRCLERRQAADRESGQSGRDEVHHQYPTRFGISERGKPQGGGPKGQGGVAERGGVPACSSPRLTWEPLTA